MGCAVVETRLLDGNAALGPVFKLTLFVDGVLTLVLGEEEVIVIVVVVVVLLAVLDVAE